MHEPELRTPDGTTASPGSLVAGLLRTIRPHQWVKNVFVLAPVVFAKELMDPALFYRAAVGFAVFCLLAGAVYTMNDLVDAEADREHPVKRKRPIAAGLVPSKTAIVFAAILVCVAVGGALTISIPFLIVALVYFGQNVAYSFRLKEVPYVDVSLIALGFVLRVMAGGYATRIDVSFYLFACTALLALFLGFGKRRHELVAAQSGGKQRAVLEAYSQRGLDVALGISSLATVVTYVAYTLDPKTQAFFQSGYLWATTVFVILGVGRFVHLVRNRPDAESPTQEMLSDGYFVAVILVWVMIIVGMVYNLQPA